MGLDEYEPVARIGYLLVNRVPRCRNFAAIT